MPRWLWRTSSPKSSSRCLPCERAPTDQAVELPDAARRGRAGWGASTSTCVAGQRRVDPPRGAEDRVALGHPGTAVRAGRGGQTCAGRG